MWHPLAGVAYICTGLETAVTIAQRSQAVLAARAVRSAATYQHGNQEKGTSARICPPRRRQLGNCSTSQASHLELLLCKRSDGSDGKTGKRIWRRKCRKKVGEEGSYRRAIHVVQASEGSWCRFSPRPMLVRLRRHYCPKHADRTDV